MTSTVSSELRSEPFPPISRLTLALYCGASGDHNPLHVDVDAARAAGFDDVIAHGMLPMAYLARFLDVQFGQPALRRLDVRFSAMTRVGDELICSAERVAGGDGSDPEGVAYSVSVVDLAGEVKLAGTAVIAPDAV